MKGSVLSLVLILGTLLIFLSVFDASLGAKTPFTQEIGLNDPYVWRSRYTASLDGVYSFKSDSYFEIKSVTDPSDVHPSQLQKPEPGEEQGVYTITNIHLEGEWAVDYVARIFTIEDSIITLTPTTGEAVINILFYVLAGLCLWLIFMYILARVS